MNDNVPPAPPASPAARMVLVIGEIRDDGRVVLYRPLPKPARPRLVD